MAVYQELHELSQRLYGELEEDIAKLLNIFERHCRNYERKARLLVDFEKRMGYVRDSVVEEHIRRIERLERLEITGNKRAEKTVMDALAQIKQGLERRMTRQGDSPMIAREAEAARRLLASLRELENNLGQQIDFFKNNKSYAERWENRQALLQLVRQEAQILFNVDKPDLENIRREVLHLLQKIRIDTAQRIGGCEKRDFSIGGIAGTVYVESFDKIPNHGVIIAAGFHNSRMQYDLLAKAIALSGFLVYTIDMPAHGDSSGHFNMGLMSEFILHSVKVLRAYFRVNKVAVIGHNVSAIASIFALVSYNQQVEKGIYQYMQQYAEMTNAVLDAGQPIPNLEEEFKSKYRQIASLIIDSVKAGRFNAENLAHSGRIDFVAGIAMQDRIQALMPPALARFFSYCPKPLLKFFIDASQNLPVMSRLRKKGEIARFERDPRYKGIQLIFMRIPEVRPFVKYMSTVKNPADYLNLLNFFAVDHRFVSYFRDRYLLDVPKFFMYGTNDKILGTANVRHTKEEYARMFDPKRPASQIEVLEGVYSALNGRSKSYAGINHIFSGKGTKVDNIAQIMTHEPALKDLVAQLKRHL